MSAPSKNTNKLFTISTLIYSEISDIPEKELNVFFSSIKGRCKKLNVIYIHKAGIEQYSKIIKKMQTVLNDNSYTLNITVGELIIGLLSCVPPNQLDSYFNIKKDILERYKKSFNMKIDYSDIDKFMNYIDILYGIKYKDSYPVWFKKVKTKKTKKSKKKKEVKTKKVKSSKLKYAKRKNNISSFLEKVRKMREEKENENNRQD